MLSSNPYAGLALNELWRWPQLHTVDANDKDWLRDCQCCEHGCGGDVRVAIDHHGKAGGDHETTCRTLNIDIGGHGMTGVRDRTKVERVLGSRATCHAGAIRNAGQAHGK